MPPKTIWIVDAAYVFSAAPGKLDYLKLKAELERLNGGGFYESYYLNARLTLPPRRSKVFIMQNLYFVLLSTAQELYGKVVENLWKVA